MVLPGTLFEELGFNYIGPMDGHDVQRAGAAPCATCAKLARPAVPARGHPQGQGLRAGRGRPDQVARPGPLRSGQRHHLQGEAASGPTYSQIFGKWLCDMAEQDPRIIAITPAMREGSGLVEFSKRFPDRYFDVAIAEQHAVTFAAGLATEGLKPVVAIYSTFLQRAYDQLIHDVALQNLPVLFALDRAGLVGSDGATHQGSYDLSYLRCIPNLVIMAPSGRERMPADALHRHHPRRPGGRALSARHRPRRAASRRHSPPCRSAARWCGARAAAGSRCWPSAPCWSRRRASPSGSTPRW